MTSLEARNIGVSPTEPTDTGIFVPAGAEIRIEFGAADRPSGESPAPFTLYAYLEGYETAAIPVADDAPLRFNVEGQLRLVPANISCGEAAGWGATTAAVSVRYDRIVTAQDGDQAGAWGPPIVRLAAADTMTITAEGAVSYWEDGEPYSLEGQGKLLEDALVPALSANSLVGVIGDYAPFLVGARAGERGETGWLWVSINDEIDKPGAFRNNSGTVSLAVDVTRAAGETGVLAQACAGGEPVPMAGESQEADIAVLELPIAPGQVLVTGAEYRTVDRRLSLVFREDGQLVVQQPDGSAIWSSLDAGAPAVPGGSAMVSFGGELALFDAQRQLVWAPVGDMAVPGSILYIDEDQALKMLSPSWTVTWPRDSVQLEAQAQAAIPAAPSVPQENPAIQEPPMAVATEEAPAVPPANPGVAPAEVVEAPAWQPVEEMVQEQDTPAAPETEAAQAAEAPAWRPVEETVQEQDTPAAPETETAEVAEAPAWRPVEEVAQEQDTPAAPETETAQVTETPAWQPVEEMVEDPGLAPMPNQQSDGNAGTAPPGILTTMWRQTEGECLTIGLGRYGLTPGAPVGMAPCAYSAEQTWSIVPMSDGYGYIANTTGEQALCLTSGDGSMAEPGTLAITVQPCAEMPAQIWQILLQDNGYYRLGSMTFSNTMCLEGAAPDYGTLDGAAFMDMCQDVSGQYWTDSLGGQ